MFIELTKLLATKQLTFDEGKIVFLKRPLIMFPMETLVDHQKKLEEYGLQNLLYFSSKETGQKWFEEMVKYYKMDYADIIKWGCKKIDLSGLGITQVKKIDLAGGQALNELKKSVFAKVYTERFGNAQYCVDNIYRGFVAGAGKLIFNGKDCHAIETKCVAKGDKFCEFVIKPVEEFDFTKKIVKEQLTLPDTNYKKQ